MSVSRRFLLLLMVSSALFAALGARWDRDLLSGSPPPAPASHLPELAKADEGAVLESVVLFNRIYQDFYATGGAPRLIDEMPASRDVKHQVFRDLGYLRNEGKILVVDEAQTILVDVRALGPDRAEATVFEEWNYVYQEAETRRPLAPVKGMGQGFRYTLALRGGRWEIEGWTPVFMERPSAREGFVW